jgi:hypothetical protein
MDTSVHGIDTRNKHHLHRPYANLTCYKKIIYAGLRILNIFPHSLQSSRMIRQNLKERKENTEIHTSFTL